MHQTGAQTVSQCQDNIYRELVSVHISTSNANIWEGIIIVSCTPTVKTLMRCRLHYSPVSSLALPLRPGVFSFLICHLICIFLKGSTSHSSAFEHTVCEDEVWQVNSEVRTSMAWSLFTTFLKILSFKIYSLVRME